MKQFYLNKQALKGNNDAKIQLSLVNLEINEWFSTEAESVLLHIYAQEIEESESMNLYHHKIHRKKNSRSVTLALDSPNGPITRHKKCSDFINDSVANLLENDYEFDERSKNILSNKLETVFTEEDNETIMKVPSKEEVRKVLQSSNLHAAPGSDGPTNYFYLKCFNTIGDTLVEELQTIFKYERPSISQRTCKM